jgi:hypothetical protein
MFYIKKTLKIYWLGLALQYLTTSLQYLIRKILTKGEKENVKSHGVARLRVRN